MEQLSRESRTLPGKDVVLRYTAMGDETRHCQFSKLLALLYTSTSGFMAADGTEQRIS